MISFSSKTTRLRFLHAAILLIWLVGVPGLRPAFHKHQDENLSAAAIEQLADHLKTYRHNDTDDASRLHFHWLVQLGGEPIPAFPNGPIPLEHSFATWPVEPSDLSAGVIQSVGHAIFLQRASVPQSHDVFGSLSIGLFDRMELTGLAHRQWRSKSGATVYCAAYL